MTLMQVLPAIAHGPFETYEDLIEFYCPPNSILQTQELPFTLKELEDLSKKMKHRDLLNNSTSSIKKED